MAVLTKVQEFYKDKTIFMTGASGFMGKVLIEKLLYSCPDLRSIIILVRPKRGKSAAQRVAEFSSLPVSICDMKIIVSFFLVSLAIAQFLISSPS